LAQTGASVVSSVGSLGERRVQLDALFAAVEAGLFVLQLRLVVGVGLGLARLLGLVVFVVGHHVFPAIGRLAALDVFARGVRQLPEHGLVGFGRRLREELLELADLLRERGAPLSARRARSCPGLRPSPCPAP
jgi:hypothetical protein